jgi:hypothetical protein
MPLEVVAGELVFDRTNPRRWRKVRIRDLLNAPGTPGLTDVGKGLCWVIPLDNRRMLAFTGRQFERYWNGIFHELGLDKYLEYLASTYPELQKRLAERVKSLANPRPGEADLQFLACARN